VVRGKTARRSTLPAIAAAFALALTAAPAYAHPDGPVSDDAVTDQHADHGHLAGPADPSGALSEHDEAVAGIVSTGPNAKVTKNVAVAGRGERVAEGATTDVWVHEKYAYLGTFNVPCGTGEGFGSGALVDDRTGPGVPVFDVHNPNKPTYVGNIPSVEGSRINDVKISELNGRDILVHSNEPCAGGPGGFEIYDVENPKAPVHLAHVQTDDINVLLREEFGYTDVGVHNNFLFTRDGRSFNAVQVEGLLGNFQVFDITDPANATLVGWFGAEYIRWPAVDWATTRDLAKIREANTYLTTGFGASRNRFLHDHFVTPDGQQAYLANWDAGLLLVDLGGLDGSAATLISQAIDVENGSLDGEVNSHSVWPTADGKIVIEGEEDFSAIVSNQPLGNFTFGQNASNTIFGLGISPIAGDAFEGSQTGNTVTVTTDSLAVTSGPLAGNSYPATEGAGNQPKIGDGSVTGEAVWIGQACNSDTLLNAAAVGEGDIAIVRRGTCSFAEKLANAASLGAAAVVVSNNVRNDTPWSGMRIWDYSDPTNPVLASTFNTACSADPFHETCDPRGTYSSHNVIVDGTKAYISWYSEGLIVLDIADPYNPVEVGRYHESGEAFEAANGGIQDIWGVYKEPGKPWIYASDRNGGLYVLKEYGAGSAKKGKQ
jgi:hypothetical protein